jgi:hypothetical protein
MALWDRQRGEPPVAFECFTVFRDLLAERSIDKAYEARRGAPLRGSTRAPSSWFVWSSKWKWTARAEAYDVHIDMLRQVAIQSATKEHGRELAQLRVDHKHFEAAVSNKMMQRVMDILNHPLTREKTREKTIKSDDGKVTQNFYKIIHPAKFSYNSAAILAIAASKIGRAGLDIGDDETDITPEDFSKNFFKTNEEIASAIEAGKVPQIPANPSAPPIMSLPVVEGDLVTVKKDLPSPMRPNNPATQKPINET